MRFPGKTGAIGLAVLFFLSSYVDSYALFKTPHSRKAYIFEPAAFELGSDFAVGPSIVLFDQAYALTEMIDDDAAPNSSPCTLDGFIDLLSSEHGVLLYSGHGSGSGSGDLMVEAYMDEPLPAPRYAEANRDGAYYYYTNIRNPVIPSSEAFIVDYESNDHSTIYFAIAITGIGVSRHTQDYQTLTYLSGCNSLVIKNALPPGGTKLYYDSIVTNTKTHSDARDLFDRLYGGNTRERRNISAGISDFPAIDVKWSGLAEMVLMPAVASFTPPPGATINGTVAATVVFDTEMDVAVSPNAVCIVLAGSYNAIEISGTLAWNGSSEVRYALVSREPNAHAQIEFDRASKTPYDPFDAPGYQSLGGIPLNEDGRWSLGAFASVDYVSPGGTVPPVPGIARNLVASTALYCTFINLTWDHPATGPVALEYRIYRSDAAHPAPVWVGSTSCPDLPVNRCGVDPPPASWQDNRPNFGILNYDYSVRATNNSGEGTESNHASGSLKQNPLPAPQNFRASNDRCDGVQFTWDWPTANPSEFWVYPSTVTSRRYRVSGAERSVIANEPSGKNYDYLLYAHNTGDFCSSATVLAVGGRLGAPQGRPDPVTATSNCDGVHLSWKYADPNAYKWGYLIYRDGVLAYRDSVQTDTTWTDSGILPETSHTYYVRAFNTCDSTKTWTVVTGGRGGPPTSAPGGVQATDGSFCCEFVRVTWSWSGSGAQGFKVFRDNSPVHTGTNPGERSWDDTSVPSGTASNPHDYHVVAYNGCGDGSQSIHDSGFRCTPITWVPDGVPICPGPSGNQSYPQAVSDGVGGAIIVWQDERNGKRDIYAQKVNSAGNPCWAINGVPICTSSGTKADIRIASDNGGGAFVVWDESRGSPSSRDVYVQRINADGVVTLATDGRLLCGPTPPAAPNRTSPQIVWYNYRAALVTWADGRSNDLDIYALAIDSTGAPFNYSWPAIGIPVCTAAGNQDIPRISLTTALSPAGYRYCVIAWVDDRGGSFQFDLYAQEFDVTADTHGPRWAANGVRITPVSYLNRPQPRLVNDDNAGAIISWENYETTTSSPYLLHAQRVQSTGALAWGTGGIRLSTASGNQGDHDLISDGAGGAMLIWRDTRTEPAAQGDIYAQRLGSNGNALWIQNGVPVCAATGLQVGPRLVSDGVGGAIAVWGDNRVSPTNLDIYARGLSPQGRLIGPSNSLPVTTAPNNQGGIAIASAAAGNAIVSWGDDRSAPAPGHIYAGLVSPQGETPPDVTMSYFVPQAGPLSTPCEGATGNCGAVGPYSATVFTGGAIGCFRTCPNADGLDILRNNARLKIVLRTQDNTPLAGIPRETICMLLNGGTPTQGFAGNGDDSLIANYQWNQAANCPDVRCIPADTSTDAAGSTFITLWGRTPGSPGVATRDPLRKWGGWAGDVPIVALGVQLQGKLTSASPLGSYTAHVKNFDMEGGRFATQGQGEWVYIDDRNAFSQAYGPSGTYSYRCDFDNNGKVDFADFGRFNGHYNDKCNYPLEAPP